MNSALNLQLEGQLAETIHLTAAISDQNVPFQPEGNTQQLQQFDRIFLTLTNPIWNLTAGDVVLRNKPDYFLRYYKNIQGAAAEANFGPPIVGLTGYGATQGVPNATFLNGVAGQVPGDVSDNPLKDVDNVSSYGPENILLASPENINYTVMVEHWSASGMPQASGQVIVNLKGKGTTIIDISGLAPSHVFSAATIAWPSGVVTPIGTDYDCTAMWSGGCYRA